MSILLYILESCQLSNADLCSLDFTFNRLFMKLFKTKSIDVGKRLSTSWNCAKCSFFGAVNGLFGKLLNLDSETVILELVRSFDVEDATTLSWSSAAVSE